MSPENRKDAIDLSFFRRFKKGGFSWLMKVLPHTEGLIL